MKNEEIAERLEELSELLMMNTDQAAEWLDANYTRYAPHDPRDARHTMIGVVAAKADILAKKLREEKTGIKWICKYVGHDLWEYDIHYYNGRMRTIYIGDKLPKTAQVFMDNAKTVTESHNDIFRCEEIIYEN